MVVTKGISMNSEIEPSVVAAHHRWSFSYSRLTFFHSFLYRKLWVKLEQQYVSINIIMLSLEDFRLLKSVEWNDLKGRMWKWRETSCHVFILKTRKYALGPLCWATKLKCDYQTSTFFSFILSGDSKIRNEGIFWVILKFSWRLSEAQHIYPWQR